MATTFLVSEIAASTTPEYALGTEIVYNHPTYGWQKYVYVLAKVAFTVGGVVMQNTGTAPNAYDGTPAVNGTATAMAKVLGVAQVTAPINTYVPVLKGGKGLFKAANTLTTQVGASLGHMGDGSGANADGVDVLGVGEEYQVIGYGLEAASGTAGDTFVGRVVLP